MRQYSAAGAGMRSLLVAMTVFAFIAGSAKADDRSTTPANAPSAAKDNLSSIVGKLPDPADNRHHEYLFTLTKNGISLKMSGDDFCHALGYGESVIYPQQPVKPKDVPEHMRCTDGVIDGEPVKRCQNGLDGDTYVERLKDGTYYKAIVFENRSKETEKEVEKPGDLNWVFCRARIEK